METLAKTQAEGRVTFFSRSKNRLWTKGEESGNHLRVVEIRTDCDADTLLVRQDGVRRLVVEFRRQQRWEIASLRPVPLRGLTPEQGSFFSDSLNTYLSSRWRTRAISSDTSSLPPSTSHNRMAAASVGVKIPP